MIVNVAILLGIYVGYRYLEARNEPSQGDADPPAPQDDDDDEGAAAQATHETQLGAGVVAIGLGATRTLGVAGPLAIPASLALTLYATLPILRRAESSLRRGKIDNNVLSSAVSVATLGLGQLFAAGLQASAYHLGQIMALRAKDASRRSLLEVAIEPDTVWRRVDDAVVRVPLETVTTSDVLVVSAGEIVPVDGTVISGQASIDERILSGESAPADKEVGDEVFATTIVVSGTIDIAVQRSGAQTAAARVAALLEQTAEFKSQLQLQGERWSDLAAGPVLLLSAMSAPFIGTSSAVAVLFAAPSNAIRATTSLQTASHLTATKRQGVLVRDGRGLEALSGIDTVLFDKTGTLTEDALDFEALHSAGTLTPQQLLVFAAALEARMSHPVAAAILAHAHHEGLDLPPVEEYAVVLGGGVRGRVEGHEVLLGSLPFIRNQQIDVDPPWLTELATAPRADCTIVFLAVDGRLQGALALKPRVRREAEQVIEQLRALGIGHIAIVSGDAAAPTESVARALKLDAWHAEVRPEQKAQMVTAMQDEGRSVCFVGDGINDALALKKANASVSIAGAATLATDTAQLVLLGGDLQDLPAVFTRSRKLHRDLKVTLGFWGTYAVSSMIGVGLFQYSVLPSTIAYATALAASGLYAAWPLLTTRAPIDVPALEGSGP